MGTSHCSFERVATLEFNMKLALILGCLSVALAEPEAQYPGLYQYHYPTVYTYPSYGLTTHSMPYVPLVYTHPQAPKFYLDYGKKRPNDDKKGGYTGGKKPNRELIEEKDLDQKQSAKYKPSYPSTTTKKSIPYGCNVDHKVKYDIEKVEYFDEKCETKYKTECYQVTKTVDYTEEECNDNYVKQCEEKWEVINGAKVWVPDTSKCINLKQTECYEVPKQRYEPEEKCDSVPYEDCQQIHGQKPQQVVCAEVSLNCKGKGKRVLTQIELRQYGIEVSEPVCKPKNGKRKFQVERFPGDIDYDYDDGKKIIG